MAKILLIDDEDNIRMMVRLALQNKHAVVEASNGVQGLELFGEAADWDLVLLDYRMPGMNGMDVLTEMRVRRPQIKAVMITAFGSTDLFRDAIRQGATDFLRKPFTIDTLRGSVQAALSRQSKPEWAETKPEVMRGDGLAFEAATLNGYRIQYRTGSATKAAGETIYTFVVSTPEGRSQSCTVLLPGYIPELVRARLNRESLPAGDRFWEALCEEALTNYLLRKAEIPTHGVIRVDELTPDLQRWVSAVVDALT